MGKETNQEKLTLLCQWLHDNGINDYIEELVIDEGIIIDLFLPTQKIAVHLSDGSNQIFYRAVCKDYKPFFIRDCESASFIIEKMRNCLDGHTCKTAPRRRKKQDPRPQIKKRQRVHINAQRVIPPK